VAVAAFNVVSSMVMIVQEKQTDIAILRTIGLPPRDVLWAFLAQGAIVTGIGVSLGVVLGMVGAHYANDFMRLVEHTFGVQFIKPDVYYINYLPTEVRTADALAVALATFAICVAATLYPAWRAAQIAPVEALRYE
jgi:lipoprotein-releasing system permease protein